MSHQVEVSGVWKRYRIRELKSLSRRILQSGNFLRTLWKNDGRSEADPDFWALRDVSLQVKAGESLGVIGPNGAGKTTLLRLLSGITRPTRGSIRVKGRIGALINVGAGFHAELTGRENIFLNGAIMGMSRAEIRSKFDRIVEFAEVGEFLDTPLKRYSAGMAVRLGFSVAAHLDPEVLLVDEVLSVGDARFRTKSTDRMRELFRSGVAVVFVSHSMRAVEQLCQKAILLDRGALVQTGDAAPVINHYFNQFVVDVRGKRTGTDREGEFATGPFQVHRIDLTNKQGDRKEIFQVGENVVLRVRVSLSKPVQSYFRGRLGLSAQDGVVLASLTSPPFRQIDSGVYDLCCEMQKLPVLPGRYSVMPSLDLDGSRHELPEQRFVVAAPLLEDTTTKTYHKMGQVRNSAFGRGVIFVEHDWSVDPARDRSPGEAMVPSPRR